MTRLDAIADPIRLAVARFLRSGAASAAEVADGVGIHLNTARSHLQKLVDAGLVRKTNESRSVPGRPVVRYRIEEAWMPAGDELLALAQLMAATLGGGLAPARERARRWGQAAAAAGTGSARSDLRAMLSRLGFEATIDREELALTSCPCPLVSPDRPAVVCALMDAAIDGALEGRGLGACSRRHDPESRHCSMALAPV
jgi:predicted ArsR family transcriptional regulator